MPLYEYACKVCDHHFDVRHSADEKPELSCPVCEGEVRKVFHASGIIFKGSGWHIKDYASKSSIPPSDEKEEAKPEAKTEAKAETKTPEPATAGAKTE